MSETDAQATGLDKYEQIGMEVLNSAVKSTGGQSYLYTGEAHKVLHRVIGYALQQAERRGKSERTCQWTHVETWDDDHYETSCDHAYCLIDGGTLEEHQHRYCPYCGGKIELEPLERQGPGEEA